MDSVRGSYGYLSGVAPAIFRFWLGRDLRLPESYRPRFRQKSKYANNGPPGVTLPQTSAISQLTHCPRVRLYVFRESAHRVAFVTSILNKRSLMRLPGLVFPLV